MKEIPAISERHPKSCTPTGLGAFLCDPDPEYDSVIIRKKWLHVGCVFWQPADFSANSEGVIQPSAEWGRLWFQYMRQASILHCASSRDINQFSFRHPCRNLPLMNSTVALSVGVPVCEKSILMPLLYTHLSSIFLQIQNHYLYSSTEVNDV